MDNQLTPSIDQSNILLEWHAPDRVFKAHSKEFFTTAGSIIFLVCVILLLIREFFLILVLVAFAFLAYMMSSVQPVYVIHKLSPKGIFTMGKFYPWEMLGRFWFDTKHGSVILMVENFGFPQRILMVIENVSVDEVREIFSQYLVEEKPPKATLEKLEDWLGKTFPLENRPSSFSSNPQKPSSEDASKK